MLFRLVLLLGLTTGCGTDGAAGDEAPARAEKRDAIEDARRLGKTLFFGKAGCAECHKLGTAGTMTVGPNLGTGDGFDRGVAARVSERDFKGDALAYVVDSMMEPDSVVVSGYRGGQTQPADVGAGSPDDAGLAAVALFVVSASGGEVSVADVERATKLVGEYRATRTHARDRSFSASLVGRIDWSRADVGRGEKLFEKEACGMCHRPGGNLPSLRSTGASKEALALKFLEARRGGRSPHPELMRAELADVAAYVAQRR